MKTPYSSRLTSILSLIIGGSIILSSCSQTADNSADSIQNQESEQQNTTEVSEDSLDSSTEENNSYQSYSLDAAGLEAAATDCANEVIAANDVTDPDPAAQDAMISNVARCIVQKNPAFLCDFGPDPVCVWNENAVKGPRIRLLDGVYDAFKSAGSPYYP
jgi:hypothetical protein